MNHKDPSYQNRFAYNHQS